MNFLLIIVLYTNVIFHIGVGQVSDLSHGENYDYRRIKRASGKKKDSNETKHGDKNEKSGKKKFLFTLLPSKPHSQKSTTINPQVKHSNINQNGKASHPEQQHKPKFVLKLPSIKPHNQNNAKFNSQRKHSNTNIKGKESDLKHSQHPPQNKVTPYIRTPTTRGKGANNLQHRGSIKKVSFTEKYKNFDITSYLSRSSFSNTVFRTIWSGFDYTRYYKDNYKYFKERILLNINVIRMYHKVKGLKENYHLSILAQEHANRMAMHEKMYRDSSQLYGENVGVIFYPAGSLIVTRWYDERSFYSFGSNYPRPGTQMLTQMLWKESKFIGIGVAKYGDYLYVDCKFYPRGNVNGQYKKNVLKKRSRCFRGK